MSLSQALTQLASRLHPGVAGARVRARAVPIAAIVAGDGRSNCYKGVQLTLVYAMIAILFYFLPA